MPDSQDNGVELHGQFNIRQFAELLNLDATDTTRLANFIRKHKSGQRPTYQEVGAAARAFVGLVDADQEVTNKAAIMLKRVDAEPKMEDSSMMENKNKSVNEGIRVAKEGIEECWDDMGGQEMTQGNGEQMSVTISMPGKNISVTTDSADEIGNILRLAGINVSAVAPEAPAEEPTAPEADVAYVGAQSTPTGVPGDVDGDGDHDMADHDAEDDAKQTKEATQTPATWTDNQGNKHPATRVQGDRYGNGESDKEEEKKDVEEAKKPDADGDGVPDWADEKHGEDDNEAKNESAEILRLAGLGLGEGKLANSPASTSMDEPTEFDSLPSHRGTGAGNKDYGLNRANNQGENPMSMHTLDIEESVEKAFEVAMGEYRKFVAENISRKK